MDMLDHSATVQAITLAYMKPSASHDQGSLVQPSSSNAGPRGLSIHVPRRAIHHSWVLAVPSGGFLDSATEIKISARVVSGLRGDDDDNKNSRGGGRRKERGRDRERKREREREREGVEAKQSTENASRRENNAQRACQGGEVLLLLELFSSEPPPARVSARCVSSDINEGSNIIQTLVWEETARYSLTTRFQIRCFVG
ncbi:hypothetical protein LZ32DRAFT_454152 [Colletotrichum eremochloae]|nr:hypothetical protein LZ32DRAFT_454152 [Colletotrichum eremochloae]